MIINEPSAHPTFLRFQKNPKLGTCTTPPLSQRPRTARLTALTEGLKRGEQTLCYRNVREDGHSCSSWLLGCGTTGAHCTRVDAGRVDRLAWRSQHGPASFLPGRRELTGKPWSVYSAIRSPTSLTMNAPQRDMIATSARTASPLF